MKGVVTDDDIDRIITASVGTMFRTAVEATCGIRFRSAHYKSSRLICDCVVTNLVLNDNITLSSANPIIMHVRRSNPAFYTSVDSSYFPVEDRFNEYAESVLNDDYAKTKADALRTANFIIYVMSVDLARRTDINRDEVILRAYTYDEIIKNKVPKY